MGKVHRKHKFSEGGKAFSFFVRQSKIQEGKGYSIVTVENAKGRKLSSRAWFGAERAVAKALAKELIIEGRRLMADEKRRRFLRKQNRCHQKD